MDADRALALTCEQRLEVFEAEYGHAYGWFVYVKGCRIAVLSDPKPSEVEPAWTWFDLRLLVNDPETTRIVLSEEFWTGSEMEYVNCKLGYLVVPFSYFITHFSVETNSPRVLLRGYPIDNPSPTFSESVALQTRKFRRWLTGVGSKNAVGSEPKGAKDDRRG